MVFSSILFMFIYLPVVLAVYYISPVKWRNPVLFVANLVFYGWGEPVYILLMMLSITVNYVNGLLIGKYKAAGDMKRAKIVLIVNVVINLSLLGFFKYYDLIVTTLSALPFIDIAPLGLTLPIGISFYTFQTMSYPIDVYRGDADVQRNYISFGTFVALFPQLIAGPIVRYKDVADQLGFRASSIDQFSSGVERFIGGLAKKVLIANNIGALWDVYAADPGNLTTLGAWLGIPETKEKREKEPEEPKPERVEVEMLPPSVPATVEAQQPQNEMSFGNDPKQFILLPGVARKRYKALLQHHSAATPPLLRCLQWPGTRESRTAYRA